VGIRRTLYKLLRISNDISAIKRGRFGRRIGRRVLRRTTGRGIRRLFK